MVREVFKLDLVVERHGIIDPATERLCWVIDSGEEFGGCQR